MGLATCSVQKEAQPSTAVSPATAELQRWGDGDGGGGGGGRGSGGETQWSHAAHLPASDREARALVARAVQGRVCKARYSSSPREVRAPDRRTEGAAVCGLAEALARPLRKVAVALRCASVRIGRQKGLHDSRRAGLLNWHDDGRRRRQREDRFGRAEAARLALAALAVNLRVKEAAPEPSCESLSLGGRQRAGWAECQQRLTRFGAALSFSRHQLAQPSTLASPATLEVHVRGGGGGAGDRGGGGGGGEVHVGQARHLHQLPQ